MLLDLPKFCVIMTLLLNGQQTAKPPWRNPLWHARFDRFKPKQTRTLCRPRLRLTTRSRKGCRELGQAWDIVSPGRHAPATPAATLAALLPAATVKKAATPQPPAKTCCSTPSLCQLSRWPSWSPAPRTRLAQRSLGRGQGMGAADGIPAKPAVPAPASTLPLTPNSHARLRLAHQALTPACSWSAAPSLCSCRCGSTAAPGPQGSVQLLLCSLLRCWAPAVVPLQPACPPSIVVQPATAAAASLLSTGIQPPGSTDLPVLPFLPLLCPLARCWPLPAGHKSAHGRRRPAAC